MAIEVSIFFSQHNCYDAVRDRGVRRIGRMVGQTSIVVVDFKYDLVAVGFEAAKIVLFVRIVRVAEVVKHGYGLEYALNHFGAKGGYSGCDQSPAVD